MAEAYSRAATCVMVCLDRGDRQTQLETRPRSAAQWPCRTTYYAPYGSIVHRGACVTPAKCVSGITDTTRKWPAQYHRLGPAAFPSQPAVLGSASNASHRYGEIHEKPNPHSRRSHARLKQRQYMMDRWMPMQQMMMNHMMQYQNWMMQQPAPSAPPPK